jgi:hypothetical protein
LWEIERKQQTVAFSFLLSLFFLSEAIFQTRLRNDFWNESLGAFSIDESPFEKAQR